MFREMRRSKQYLDKEECEDILKRGSHCVLAFAGDDGYPYALPISYAYEDGRIYMHGAGAGHKIDSIRRNDKVSFTVVDQDLNVPSELTIYFRSVVCFGRARILTDEEEKIHCCRLVAGKYSPGFEEKAEASIARQLHAMGCIEIAIEHMTGKQAIELVKDRKQEDMH
ncbi:MAG: pyridoxamine 5'-phosphate oxidase family protein [Lachnospiraceae bacterium]|nr:pyridoxamine 5'-phosphate oxidase family protein [Lachnospiraceae bacterium]